MFAVADNVLLKYNQFEYIKKSFRSSFTLAGVDDPFLEGDDRGTRKIEEADAGPGGPPFIPCC